MTHHHTNNKRAFTLIELLVVIAIIAMLAAILLPALSAAKRRALGVGCVNNLKQTATAVILYAQDNGDNLPANGATQLWGLTTPYSGIGWPLGPSEEQLGPWIQNYLTVSAWIDPTFEDRGDIAALWCPAYQDSVAYEQTQHEEAEDPNWIDDFAEYPYAYILNLIFKDGKTAYAVFESQNNAAVWPYDPSLNVITKLTRIPNPTVHYILCDIDYQACIVNNMEDPKDWMGKPPINWTPVHGSVRGYNYYDGHADLERASEIQM